MRPQVPVQAGFEIFILRRRLQHLIIDQEFGGLVAFVIIKIGVERIHQLGSEEW